MKSREGEEDVRGLGIEAGEKPVAGRFVRRFGQLRSPEHGR